MRTTSKGYFVVSMRSKRSELPWLSVPQEIPRKPRDSPLGDPSSTKTMSPLREASNSREATVQNGSHLAKTHGAVDLVQVTLNQATPPVRMFPAVRHPPTTTGPPSTLASNL